MTVSRAGSVRSGSRPSSVYANNSTRQQSMHKSWARSNNAISSRGAAVASLRINTNVPSVRKKSVSHYSFPILSASEYISQKGTPGDAIEAMRAHCSSEPGESSLESNGTLICRSIAPSTAVVETPVLTSNPQTTPPTSRSSGIWPDLWRYSPRLWPLNLHTPVEHGKVKPEDTDDPDLVDVDVTPSLNHGANTYSAQLLIGCAQDIIQTETIPIEETSVSPSTSSHSISHLGSPEPGITGDTGETEDVHTTSSLVNGEGLPPASPLIVPSAIDSPLTMLPNPRTPTPPGSFPLAADSDVTPGDNDSMEGVLNEGESMCFYFG